MRRPEPEWSDSYHYLATRRNHPGQKMARLLAQAEERWLGRVIARTSMFDLLFTRPGDHHPFDEQVRVRWTDGIYEFWLHAGYAMALVTADRCSEAYAPAVLDRFLIRLVGDPDEPAQPPTD